MEEDPGTDVQRTDAAKNIGVHLVSRILHEQSLYTYHIQRVQVLTPLDQRAKVVFCL
jgi:hypothetical protein